MKTRLLKNEAIPQACLCALRTLEKSGYEAWIVGGAVRDLLLGKEVKDWDIASNADVETLLQCFSAYRCLEMGRAHGTITVLIDAQPLEITSFRGREASLVGDLALRDFTLNAMAYHPERGLRDPFGGQRRFRQAWFALLAVPLSVCARIPCAFCGHCVLPHSLICALSRKRSGRCVNLPQPLPRLPVSVCVRN